MFKMKKLLVLLFVLGLVSVANAGIIDVTITSLNGVTITNTKEITVNPSDMVDIRIMFNGPATEYLFGIQSFINVVGPGTLDWTIFSPAVWDAEELLWVYDDLRPQYDPALHVKAIENDKTYMIEGALAAGRPGTGAGTEVWIVKDIQIHCDGQGPVIVSLSDRGLGSKVVDAGFVVLPYSYGNGVIIHQIPEPMTLMLLGLGSLFLIRRKK
jgi:hypothetical protein